MCLTRDVFSLYCDNDETLLVDTSSERKMLERSYLRKCVLSPALPARAVFILLHRFIHIHKHDIVVGQR